MTYTQKIPYQKPLNTAHSYIQLGLPIIPLCSHDHSGMSRQHKETCENIGKVPLLKNWPKWGVPTEIGVQKWEQRWPWANIGLPIGDPSGLVGVDIDGDTGEKLLQEWSQGDLPPTWEFRTNSGRRLIYKIPHGVKLKKFSQADRDKDHEELALLGNGQQTVIPPSIHESGFVYQWSPGRDPWSFGEPAMAPGWIIERMTKRSKSKHDGGISECSDSSVLERLAQKCQRFRRDWEIQRNKGLDEETWFLWISLFVAAGKNEDAWAFSRASQKHNERSDSRLSLLIERQQSDPLPPVRCTSFGCPQERIKACFSKLNLNEDGEITNSPATLVKGGSYVILDSSSKYLVRGKFIPKRLGDDILNDFHFICAGQALYVYLDGVYQPIGAEIIRQEARKRLGDEFRQQRVNETVYYIETSSKIDPKKKLNAHSELLNLRNGMLNWKTLELFPHNPEYLSTIRIPVTYDPKATCPMVDKFFNTITYPECVPLLEEIIGYCLVPDTRFEKAMMLVGTGANGKSTFINLLTALIGSENISKIPLQELSENRFKRAELFGRLVNVFSDLSPRSVRDSSYFKAIVSGDDLDAERKHKDPFFFKPFARLVYSANEIPKSSDRTFAYYRRWIIVPFPYQFTRGEADRDLINKLTTEQELSGLLNRALKGLQRLFENGGFTENDYTNQMLENYKTDNDSVTAFIRECCLIEPAVYVPKVQLYNTYKTWCVNGSYKPVSNRNFYERVQHLYPGIREKRPGGGGSFSLRNWPGGRNGCMMQL